MRQTLRLGEDELEPLGPWRQQRTELSASKLLFTATGGEAHPGGLPEKPGKRPANNASGTRDVHQTTPRHSFATEPPDGPRACGYPPQRPPERTAEFRRFRG